MTSYDNHLVSGAAMERILQELHADQQRQDTTIDGIEASLPTGLDVTEIAGLWNETNN